MTETTWIELYQKAPEQVKHACRRAMSGKTTAKFETERLGEKNFEWPPAFNHIWAQFKAQNGNVNDLGEG